MLQLGLLLLYITIYEYFITVGTVYKINYARLVQNVSELIHLFKYFLILIK